MVDFGDIAQELEKQIGFLFTIILFGILVYIWQMQIVDLTDKFTVVTGSLLGFVSVFYTLIILSDFLKRLSKLNEKETNRLKKEIENISKKEKENLLNFKYKENSNLCNDKMNVYSELSNIKNRRINRLLFVAALLLISILVLDNVFIPNMIYGIPKIYFLVTLFWIAINFIIKIIIIFYKVYSD